MVVLEPVALRLAASPGPTVDAISNIEAADILDVGVTAIPKMVRSGRLTRTYPGHKRRLSRAVVEELAAARWRPRHHSETNYWITGPEVADLLGCTTTTVYRMAREGRLPEPHRAHGWLLFRRHQLEVIANAPRRRRGRRTRSIGSTHAEAALATYFKGVESGVSP